MSKLNGATKWAGIIIAIVTVIVSAAVSIKVNSNNIENLKTEFTEEVKDKQLDKRIIQVETAFMVEVKNIKTTLKRIEERMP